MRDLLDKLPQSQFKFDLYIFCLTNQNDI